MSVVIGIDLGTTNSCVAVLEGGRPVVIPNRNGYPTTPSVVALTQDGRRLVGQLAKRQAITNPQNTVYATKRLIGCAWDSEAVRHALGHCSYRIVPGPHQEPLVDLQDQRHALPELSAWILQELKGVAETHLGIPVTRAVVTVPAHFNDQQRQATKDAGRIAGLEVIGILNEPTAAALAYGWGKELHRRLAVFDLGGGTFDISILEIGNSVYQVIASSGDDYLGGEDFDQCIIDWLAEQFSAQQGIDLRTDPVALQRLKEAAEQAKCQLSSASQAEIHLPFVALGPQDSPLHLHATLDRATLEHRATSLIRRTIDLCRSTLDEARLAPEAVDEVLLVGGMTRMPAVQRAVAEFFGRPPSHGAHPDEVVALGAALHGAALVGQQRELVLLDVVPHSLGIMVGGGDFYPLIQKNTPLPTSHGHVFTTTRDAQTTMRIFVFQGESKRARYNHMLGDFLLTGLPSAPMGALEVEVTFTVSTEAIVAVSARERQTGAAHEITVAAQSSLSESQIARLATEAQDYVAQVKQAEVTERRRQEAERLLMRIQALSPDAQRALACSSFGEQAISRANTVITQAQTALRTPDAQAVDEACAALARTLSLFEAVLQRSK